LTQVDENMDDILDNLEPCVLTITGDTSNSDDDDDVPAAEVRSHFEQSIDINTVSTIYLRNILISKKWQHCKYTIISVTNMA
jgi:hypothetical protein